MIAIMLTFTSSHVSRWKRFKRNVVIARVRRWIVCLMQWSGDHGGFLSSLLLDVSGKKLPLFATWENLFAIVDSNDSYEKHHLPFKNRTVQDLPWFPICLPHPFAPSLR